MVNFVTDRVIPGFAAVLIAMMTAMIACVCVGVFGGWGWAPAVERMIDWIFVASMYTGGGLLLAVLSLIAYVAAEDHYIKAVVRSDAYRLMEQEKEMWRTSYRKTCQAYAKALAQTDALRKTVTKVEAELERLEALVPMTETETAALDNDIENVRDMLVTYLAPCKRA